MKKILALALALCALASFSTKASEPTVSPKVMEIFKQLTLEEKVALCHGDMVGFTGIERLGIPHVLWTGSGHGPNSAIGVTAYPCGIGQAATWNPDLLEEVGSTMGEETRALGCLMLLGPGVNILRDPLGGRFFEYYSEDPYLCSRVGVAVIKGIQSQRVAACVKHYACNNRDNNRDWYMSIVDDRTLHEIYLPPYKAAIQEADVMEVMTSANGVNDEFVSDSRKMMTDILKDRWGFKGFSMTDWLQTRSTEKACFAGLDVSMPGSDRCGFGTPLLEAAKAGRVSIHEIDEKVLRILSVYERIGALDGYNDIVGDCKLDTPEHHAVAYEAAKESITLLKNEGNALPWSKKVKKVLVTGPNADKRFNTFGMGGSSWTESSYETTVLKGLQAALGESNVTFVSSDDLGGFISIPSSCLQPVDGVPGFKARYYVKGKEEPVISRTEKNIDFMWEMRSPDASIPVEEWRDCQFEAVIMPPVDGKYTFKFIANGGSAWVYDGFFGGAPMAIADKDRGTSTVTATVDLKKDKLFRLCVAYHHTEGDAAMHILWETPQTASSESKLAKLDKLAKKVDAVVYVGGLDHNLDTEGRDRVSLDFPVAQQTLINRLSKLNKNFTVVLLNGSPIELGGWLDNVNSVVEAYYPGMEGGTAVADVLTGKLNPSGRLSFTWPKKYSDTPAQKLGYEDNDRILFTDSLMVGYRYYDTKNVAPEFPFGFGLSYTTFEYSNLNVDKSADGKVVATVDIKNTGKMEGKDVVQLYVKPVNPSIFRPVHELKAFKKIGLKPGESTTVEFNLGDDAFSYYDVTKGDWTVDRCDYEIEIGENSEDIKLAQPVNLK